MPGHEPRPTDTSLPVMRIEQDGDEVWIHESIAILEYFEEMFSFGSGYVDLRGKTQEERAKTRDVLSLLADAVMWSSVALIHSNSDTTFWSGLSEDQMSKGAADQAGKKLKGLLERLEKWVEGGKKGTSVTLADLCLVAQVEYMRENYGTDWVNGHGVLRDWCDRVMKEGWFVGREDLEGVERSGDWSVVLGS